MCEVLIHVRCSQQTLKQNLLSENQAGWTSFRSPASLNREIDVPLGGFESPAVRLDGDKEDKQGGLGPHQTQGKVGETH